MKKVTFKEFIYRYIELSFFEWQLIKSRLRYKTYKKGERILNLDDICQDIVFVEDGYARAYVIDENGKDYTWSIMFNNENSKVENLFAIDFESFLQESPSRLEIEALSECKTVLIKKSDLDFLQERSKKVERFCRLMTEEGYSYLHNLILDRQTKSAKKRVEEFLQTKSHLLSIVPQYHIASLLDITPQHLSRLKREINIDE